MKKGHVKHSAVNILRALFISIIFPHSCCKTAANHSDKKSRRPEQNCGNEFPSAFATTTSYGNVTAAPMSAWTWHDMQHHNTVRLLSVWRRLHYGTVVATAVNLLPLSSMPHTRTLFFPPYAECGTPCAKKNYPSRPTRLESALCHAGFDENASSSKSEELL